MKTLLLIIIIFAQANVFGQYFLEEEGKEEPKDTVDRSNYKYNIVCVKLSYTEPFNDPTYSFSGDIERIISDNFSLKLGIGYGNYATEYELDFLSDKITRKYDLTAFGPSFVVNYYSKGDLKIAFGLGAGYYSVSRYLPTGELVEKNWEFSGIMKLGFRYQPNEGDYYAGLYYSDEYSVGGIELSLGYMF